MYSANWPQCVYGRWLGESDQMSFPVHSFCINVYLVAGNFRGRILSWISQFESQPRSSLHEIFFGMPLPPVRLVQQSMQVFPQCAHFPPIRESFLLRRFPLYSVYCDFIVAGSWMSCYILSVNYFQLRQTERSMSVLTPLHLTLIKDILKLSVSEYAQVSENSSVHLLIS